MFYDIIGYVAILFAIIASISKDRNKMLLNNSIATILFGISIFFYQGYNGLFVSIISLLSKLISFKITKTKAFYLKILSFFIALIFFYFVNKEGIIGILPAISLVFIIWADIQENIIKMKLIYFGSLICWLIYGIALNSIPAILFDIINGCFLIYGIFLLKNKKCMV